MAGSPQQRAVGSAKCTQVAWQCNALNYGHAIAKVDHGHRVWIGTLGGQKPLLSIIERRWGCSDDRAAARTSDLGVDLAWHCWSEIALDDFDAKCAVIEIADCQELVVEVVCGPEWDWPEDGVATSG